MVPVVRCNTGAHVNVPFRCIFHWRRRRRRLKKTGERDWNRKIAIKAVRIAVNTRSEQSLSWSSIILLPPQLFSRILSNSHALLCRVLIIPFLLIGPLVYFSPKFLLVFLVYWLCYVRWQVRFIAWLWIGSHLFEATMTSWTKWVRFQCHFSTHFFAQKLYYILLFSNLMQGLLVPNTFLWFRAFLCNFPQLFRLGGDYPNYWGSEATIPTAFWQSVMKV